jgi:hypothetical protein
MIVPEVETDIKEGIMKTIKRNEAALLTDKNLVTIDDNIKELNYRLGGNMWYPTREEIETIASKDPMTNHDLIFLMACENKNLNLTDKQKEIRNYIRKILNEKINLS